MRARPCPIISQAMDAGQATNLHPSSIYTFLFSVVLVPTGFSALQLLVSKDMAVLKMPPLEHKVMARAVARVRAVGVLGVAPLEEPVTDRFCDSLVAKTRRVA